MDESPGPSVLARWLPLPDLPHVERLRTRLVVIASVVVGCLAVPYSPLYLLAFSAPRSAVVLALTAPALLATPLVLRATGSTGAAARWFLGVLMLVLLVLSVLDGGTGTPIFALPLVPLIAAMMDTSRAAVGWSVATLAALAALLVAGAAGVPFPDEVAEAHRGLFDPAVALGVTIAATAPAVLHRALADRALGELGKRHAETRAILDGTADGIASVDRAGRVLSANDGLARIVGAEHLVGRALPELLGLDGGLTVGVRACRRVSPGGKTLDLELTTGVIAGDGPASHVVTVRDVTVHREAARAIEARDRALEATRAKSGFLANMSHELRTPLNAILGYAEVLLEEVAETGTASEADLRRIHDAGRHLLALIDDVLDLGRIEAGRMELSPERNDVRALAASVVETARPIAARHATEVELEVADDVGPVWADAMRLRQILLNLAGNAAKFTREGRVGLRVFRDGGAVERVVFEVWDTGIGIAPDRLEAVFEEFVQADASTTRKFGGSGLGLAISRRLARMMGGDITVESRLGVGSTFRLAMPVRPAVSFAVPEPGPARGPVVLVVDDDPAARDLLGRALARGGFRAVEAEDGPSALALCREVGPVAITLDVVLPGMDGWQILAALKADPASAGIPVVLVTMVDDRSTGLALGATHHLTKPVDRDALLRVVSHVVAGPAGGSLLLVEDDGALRDLLSRSLGKAGYAVSAAENGKVALDLLAAADPRAVLLDLTMPVMDGFDFLATIRRDPRWRHLPVVVLTARDLSPEERAWLQSEAQRVLTKAAVAQGTLLEQVLEAVRVAAGAGP